MWESDVQHAGQEDRTTMKRHRHTPEQIVRKLREGDRLLNEGTDLAEVLRALEVSESSWNRWRSQYGGMKANEAKRLRELESENARLKKLLAEAELDKSMLKELACTELVVAVPALHRTFPSCSARCDLTDSQPVPERPPADGLGDVLASGPLENGHYAWGLCR